MRRTKVAELVGSVVIALACNGFGDRDEGPPDGPFAPTAPTAPAPGGCSGTPIDGVTISIGGDSAATVQVFGETLNIPAHSGQSGQPLFEIKRAVVPCDYVMTGQVANQPGVFITFMRAAIERERETNPGGVEKGSIVFEQGQGTFVPDDDGNVGCQVLVGDREATEFRVRFRVVGDSNANVCF